MNKNDWETMADERLGDARSLLDTGRWSAAYHFIGYAVECALKACILKYVLNKPEIIFLNKRYSERTWTHDPAELVKLADLETELDNDIGKNAKLGDNWALVKVWTVDSRYQRKTQIQAEKLFAAAADQPDGVMQWIKGHW